jgi:putative tryptophan/tyrosine transport system substrate-binding protein
MRRRDLITLVGGAAAAWPLAGLAQQSKNIPRLCFVDFMLDPGTLRSARFEGFFRGLSDLGYVDGQTIAIDYLSADGHGERFPDLVAECLRRNVDIIAVSTTPAAQAAKSATHTTPIVMIALGDPVGTGLVNSLANPGGPQVKSLEKAARSLGVTLQIQDIKTADDLPAAFEAGARERVDGLVITAESIFIAHRARVSELAASHRLPAMYPYTIQVADAGGLMAYDADYSDLQRRAAAYVDRILKGAKPSGLPVQQPSKFALVINLKAAKVLGLTISESFLLRADQVIE